MPQVLAPVHSSEPQQLMSGYRKFAIWAALIISVTIIAVKLNMEHKMKHIVGYLFATAIALTILYVCGAALYRTKTISPVPIPAVLPVSLPTRPQDFNEDLTFETTLALTTDPPSSELPPPSYLTATLLPQQNSMNTEDPPPTYEKATE